MLQAPADKGNSPDPGNVPEGYTFDSAGKDNNPNLNQKADDKDKGESGTDDGGGAGGDKGGEKKDGEGQGTKDDKDKDKSDNLGVGGDFKWPEDPKEGDKLTNPADKKEYAYDGAEWKVDDDTGAKVKLGENEYSVNLLQDALVSHEEKDTWVKKNNTDQEENARVRKVLEVVVQVNEALAKGKDEKDSTYHMSRNAVIDLLKDQEGKSEKEAEEMVDIYLGLNREDSPHPHLAENEQLKAELKSIKGKQYLADRLTEFMESERVSYKRAKEIEAIAARLSEEKNKFVTLPEAYAEVMLPKLREQLKAEKEKKKEPDDTDVADKGAGAQGIKNDKTYNNMKEVSQSLRDENVSFNKEDNN